jgi:hypothetical protein
MTPYTTQEILAALERPIDAVITIDFETYYADDYTLSSMTTEGYVRDPRFEVILVGVKVGTSPAVWMLEEDFRRWAATVNWARVAVLAHHAHFDGLILSHHFGIIPAFYLCTLSQARAIHGTEVGGSLGKLAVHYQLGEKGHEVVQAKNKRLRRHAWNLLTEGHRCACGVGRLDPEAAYACPSGAASDFSPEELAAYGGYCINDCDLEFKLLYCLTPQLPEIELWVIDSVVRFYTESLFRLNEKLLQDFLVYERARKQALLDRIGADKKTLSSNEKFAALLRTFDVEPPTKTSPSTGQPIYAFAKSDPGMQELLDHPEDEVRWLAEARIAIKSTINETRTERLLRAGSGGRAVPVYLKYSGAHTHRLSGGDRLNFHNFERVPEDPKPGEEWKGTLRKALEAPMEAA